MLDFKYADYIVGLKNNFVMIKSFMDRAMQVLFYHLHHIHFQSAIAEQSY